MLFSGKTKTIVQILIDKERKINQIGREGQTPLTAACIRTNEKLIKVFIDKDRKMIQVVGTGQPSMTSFCQK